MIKTRCRSAGVFDKVPDRDWCEVTGSLAFPDRFCSLRWRKETFRPVSKTLFRRSSGISNGPRTFHPCHVSNSVYLPFMLRIIFVIRPFEKSVWFRDIVGPPDTIMARHTMCTHTDTLERCGPSLGEEHNFCNLVAKCHVVPLTNALWRNNLTPTQFSTRLSFLFNLNEMLKRWIAFCDTPVGLLQR